MERQYHKRAAELLGFFPCVAIVGVRQCGKTTFVEQLAELAAPSSRWRYIDLEKASDYDQIAQDPDLFFRLHPERIALDEAQTLPSLFRALRVAIDADRGKKGRFIITGSSSPTLIAEIAETLAGRVGLIEMAPFTASEAAGLPACPLISLLAPRHRSGGAAEPIGADGLVDALEVRQTLAHVHDYWFRGGYPGPYVESDPAFHAAWMDNYVQTYLERDVARLFPGMDAVRYRRFISTLAGLSGRIVNYSDAARALSVSQPTTRHYFEIADGTYIWRSLPAYVKNSLKRVVKSPKGYLRDAGLLHRLLRIPTLDALLSHPQMGASWEGMVIEELLRGFQIHGTSVDAYHYRTAAGAEIDLILEGPFGLLPIEIKYTQSLAKRDWQPLRTFMDKYGCPLGLVIHNAERAHRCDEGIVAVPFAAL